MMKPLKDVTVGEWIETCDQRKKEHDRLQHDDPCLNCVMRPVCENPIYEWPKRYLADTLIDMLNFDKSSAKSLDKIRTSKIDEPNSNVDSLTCCGNCNKADVDASNELRMKCKLTGEYHTPDDECDCQDTPSNTDDEEAPNEELPKILSALGVELEETFMIKGYPKMLFWIDSKGRLNSSFANDLVKCINDNSNIIHIPK